MISRNKWLCILPKAVLFGVMVYALITVPGKSGWINSWYTMHSLNYIQDSIHDTLHPPSDAPPAWDGKVGDKVIVMARLETEDTSWVEKQLPDWQRAIYTVPSNKVPLVEPSSAHLSPSSATNLTLPANKGNEAMAYLTYLIDFYETLPSLVLFLHAHEGGYHKAWHVDARLHSNVVATRELQLPLVRERGYVNLRCNPYSNCLHHKGNRHPPLLTRDIWVDLWNNTSTPAREIETQMSYLPPIDDADNEHKPAPDTSPDDWPDLDDYPTPPLADPSGAQFAVTRNVIHKRPREDYILMREWLLNTPESDANSGRVFEYTWHVIFGMPGVHCYERFRCECDVFGRCGGA